MADFPESECLGLCKYTDITHEPIMLQSDNEHVYEFTLSPSMFSDFAYEAYGKGAVDIVASVICLLLFIPMLIVISPQFSGFSWLGKAGFLFAAVACANLVLLLVFPSYRKRVAVGGRVQKEVDVFDWFDYGGPMFPSMYSLERQGASSPCRFVMMDDRVRLMRMPAGRMVVEDVPWAAFGKVTVTRSCVVLRPGALDRGSIHFNGPYWSHVSAGGIGCSILVGLDAVPDVDGFVEDCRSRIAEATSRMKEETLMGDKKES